MFTPLFLKPFLLYLVRLHPDSEEKTYDLLSVPILEKEMSELFEERKKHL